MKVSPWFLPAAEAAVYYAKRLREMQWLERLARACGRDVRPRQ